MPPGGSTGEAAQSSRMNPPGVPSRPLAPKRKINGDKDSKKNKKRKDKRRTLPAAATSNDVESSQQSRAQRGSTATNPPQATIKSPVTRQRAKETPARFVHPQLNSELLRLRRSWLSPGDPLYPAALRHSFKGMEHLPSRELPSSVHTGFRRSFDALNEAGLFLYDTVQAGGKRLSRTFVTRTLIGDPGITYKYLGLRLFAHPWDGAGDYHAGPGDGLADALNDPCLADLFARPAEGAAGSKQDKTATNMKKTAQTLQKVGNLSKWMQTRAEALLAESKEREIEDEGGKPPEHGGSCAFNLTLINRMECAATKRDLKPDPLFSMGKCSVSWHADSCLEDFSTIGVYHCTEPAPLEPDWGIALRVSKEREEGVKNDDDGGGSNATFPTATPQASVPTRRQIREEYNRTGMGRGDGADGQDQGNEVVTPPLLVPLQSGDAYFLLDDFNHFHEHAVVSGSSTLRYSSTHRVASVEGNTFSHVQRRCEVVLASGGGGGESIDLGSPDGATGSRQMFDIAQVRAEQELLTELEFEWLNQFWVQGRTHAALHPWWRGPMALVVATWRELERRTAEAVKRLLSLQDRTPSTFSSHSNGGGVGRGRALEPAMVSKIFETVLRALEERRESRSRWATRFRDSAYRSLSTDCAPAVPALWADASAGPPRWEPGEDVRAFPPLPKDLDEVISRLRDCYTVTYRVACGGKKAGSAKAIAAGATSNWELFRSTPDEGSRASSEKHEERDRGAAKTVTSVGDRGGRGSGRDLKSGIGTEVGSKGRGRSKGKGSKKRRR